MCVVCLSLCVCLSVSLCLSLSLSLVIRQPFDKETHSLPLNPQPFITQRDRERHRDTHTQHTRQMMMIMRELLTGSGTALHFRTTHPRRYSGRYPVGSRSVRTGRKSVRLTSSSRTPPPLRQRGRERRRGRGRQRGQPRGGFGWVRSRMPSCCSCNSSTRSRPPLRYG